MKKSILVALFAIALCGGALAQSGARSKVVTREEVPVAVMQSFQKEHSDIEKGTWKLYYTEKSDGGKTIFTPERYTFSGKKDGEKIQLTYSTAGVLENSKTGSSGARK